MNRLLLSAAVRGRKNLEQAQREQAGAEWLAARSAAQASLDHVQQDPTWEQETCTPTPVNTPGIRGHGFKPY